MAGKPGYKVPRTATEHGDSIIVSLPKRELQRLGRDPDEFAGEDLVCTVDEDAVTYKLPE